MVTVSQQSRIMDKIKSMSELELSGLIDEIRTHCDKNRMSHLFDDDQVQDLENELENMEADLDAMIREKDQLIERIDLIQDAVKEFDTTASEPEMQKELDKILSI